MCLPRSHVPPSSFTHVDPFEDTESCHVMFDNAGVCVVSPTSIRSRILKDLQTRVQELENARFTHVDPFEDTESNGSLTAQESTLWFHPRRSVRGY